MSALHARRTRAAWTAALVLLTACAGGDPRPIEYGDESCAVCRMTISDPRFGAEVRTKTGKVWTFDSIECAATFANGGDSASVARVWVSDHNAPGTLVPVDEATFWQLAGGASPMGKGLVATTGGVAPASGVVAAGPWEWADVTALMAREGLRGHGHAAHAGNGAGDVVVSPDGPVRTLAEGVRRAPAEGRVVVRAGTYREPTVVVDKPLTIEGQGWPTLDGEGARSLLLVRADDVTVSGIRFAHVGTSMTEDRAAIRITEARRCAVTGNRFDDTFFGVYLARVEGCRVTGNVFAGLAAHASESTSGNAIHLWSVRDVDIADNRIAGHRDGIYFEFVRQGRVAGNVSEDNIRYGLHFMFSDSNRYDRNVFRRNGAGVAVMYTNHVTMTDNQFVDNRGGAAYGLLLKDIGDPVLRGNTFARNTVGLLADGATRLVAEDNVFAANGWGVRLLANVQETRLARNDFVGNTFDVATNGRTDEGAVLVGNYFDEYRGYDLDRDGAGDVPHRPVRLFSVLVERWDAALVLQRSFFVGLVDGAERMLPSLTPAGFADRRPAMHPVALAGAVP